MSGQIVHFEIPADDTAKSREFWGSLFGWQFKSMPGPFEYHMTEITPGQTGLAITNMEAGQARGPRLLRRRRDQRRCGASEGTGRRGR